MEEYLYYVVCTVYAPSYCMSIIMETMEQLAHYRYSSHLDDDLGIQYALRRRNQLFPSLNSPSL
jgi:hypothetical protein